MAILALFIGILGISGMTWIFPALGRARGRDGTPGSLGALPGQSARVEVRKIAILLPGHDEEEAVDRTLASIAVARSKAAICDPAVEIEVLVGADFCKDSTTEVAAHWGARVVSSSRRIGKWRMLRDLVKAAGDADWVVLVDAGAIWPRDLLARALPLFRKRELIGVATGYRNPGGGRLEGLYWRLESRLRKMEAALGGPVSLHRATAAYRREPLARTIAGLGNRNWLSDDVVIPLALRTVNTGMRIEYMDDVVVHDSSHTCRSGRSARKELDRRLRIASGNAQWIRALFSAVWRTDALVGTLAMREVFRLFWAYWFLMLAASAALVAPDAVARLPLPIVAALVCALSLPPVRRLFQAWIASLIAPIFLVFEPAIGKTIWK